MMECYSFWITKKLNDIKLIANILTFEKTVFINFEKIYNFLEIKYGGANFFRVRVTIIFYTIFNSFNNKSIRMIN